MNFLTGWSRRRCRASAILRGLSPRKFDGRGNYTFGINDQAIFPGDRAGKSERMQGMDITIVTDAGDNAHALDLLKLMGFPFAEK